MRDTRRDALRHPPSEAEKRSASRRRARALAAGCAEAQPEPPPRVEDWRTPAERRADREGLSGTWWRCQAHGLTDRPLLLGHGETAALYCPADECSAQVLLARSAAQDDRGPSVWTRSAVKTREQMEADLRATRSRRPRTETDGEAPAAAARDILRHLAGDPAAAARRRARLLEAAAAVPRPAAAPASPEPAPAPSAEPDLPEIVHAPQRWPCSLCGLRVRAWIDPRAGEGSPERVCVSCARDHLADDPAVARLCEALERVRGGAA